MESPRFAASFVSLASLLIAGSAGAQGIDTHFRVTLVAVSGDPTNFPDKVEASDFLAMAEEFILSDGDTTTWELVTTNLTLPVGTDYVGIHIAPNENVFNDTTGTEFDGHYADDVQYSTAILNGGFESAVSVSPGESPPWPDAFADAWQGDEAEIVTVENGITPFEGTRMLHFISAQFAGGAGPNGSSNMWQIVDAPGALPADVTASARFNRVKFGAAVPLLGGPGLLALGAMLLAMGIAASLRFRRPARSA
jgi:hypothetical protein